MALWNIQPPSIESHDFVTIVPAEVLAEFDGPLTITFLDRNKVLILAHLCAVDVGVSRYVACRTTDRTVDNLKRGAISIRAALTRQPLWLIDVASDGRVARVWQQNVSELPAGAIPEPDVLLSPELEERAPVDAKSTKFLLSESDAQLVLDGAPVVNHEIDAGFFGKFSDQCSGLIVAMAEAIGIAPPTLMLGMTSPSSYAVDFRLLDSPGQAFPELFDPTQKHESKSAQLLDSLVSMIVDETQPPEIVTLIKRSQSVRQRYGDILELMSHKSASLILRTRSDPVGRRLTNQQAAHRLDAVKKLGYPYSFLQVRGTLIEGQIEKTPKHDYHFIIRVNQEHYLGSVDEQAIQKMKSIKLGDEVSAKLAIQVDKGEQTYKLRDIDLATDGSSHGVK